MKKIFMIMLMMVLMAPSAKAQDVYMEILSKSKAMAADENGNPLLR